MAFSHFKAVTIDPTQCGASDSTNFPVTIWVTDADLKTVANGGKVQNSSGYDIRPYANSGLTIALTYELVASVYDPTTGQLEMHVKIPTVSHTSGTVFYLAFGDASLNTDGTNLAGTWAGGSYLTVWHLPNGTTMSGNDSSGNGHTLSAGGSTGTLPTATTGELDGGATFPTGGGLDPGFINATNPQSGLTTYSVSGWMKAASAGGGTSFGRIFCIDDSNPANTPALLMFGAATTVGFTVTGGPVVQATGVAINTWHHVVGTFASGVSNGTKIYVDGALAAQDTTTATLAAGAVGMAVGNNYFGARIFDGILDEVRTASVALGPDWITAEYNNQKPGSTFLTWGALTPVGGAPRNMFLMF